MGLGAKRCTAAKFAIIFRIITSELIFVPLLQSSHVIFIGGLGLLFRGVVEVSGFKKKIFSDIRGFWAKIGAKILPQPLRSEITKCLLYTFKVSLGLIKEVPLSLTQEKASTPLPLQVSSWHIKKSKFYTFPEMFL